MKLKKIPIAIKLLLADEVIPRWVLHMLDRSEGTGLMELDSLPDLDVSGNSEALLFYLKKAVQPRLKSAKRLSEIKCFPNLRIPIDESHLDVIGLSVRTHNGLARFISENPEKSYDEITLRDLAFIDGLGVNSLIELLVKVESFAIDFEEGQESDEVAVDGFLQSVSEGLWSDWARSVCLRDPRFEEALWFIPGSLRGDHVYLSDLVLETELNINDPSRAELASNLYLERENIRQLLEIEDCRSLDSTLLRLCESTASRVFKKRPEIADLFARRFGWSGQPPATLEVCGMELGVTRERFRQLEAKFKKAIPPGIEIKRLEEADQLLSHADGFTVRQAGEFLVQEGICSIPIDPRGLMNAFELIGKESGSPFDVNLRDGNYIVEVRGGQSRAILKAAGKLCSRNGLFTNADLMRRLGLEETDDENWNQILRNSKDFISIDIKETLWVKKLDAQQRNRLVNVTTKVLSCVEQVNLKTIRESLKRLYGWRNSSSFRDDPLIVPSLDSLRFFFGWHPDFEMNSDVVSSKKKLDPSSVLEGNDLKMLRVLSRNSKGFMSRREFLRACIDEGVEESSAQVLLTYSPIFEHVTFDTWKIVGRPIDAAAVAQHLEATRGRPRDKRIPYHGWLDNKIALVLVLPEFQNNFVVGCPSPYHRYLLGSSFRILDKDGNEYGELRDSDGSFYGFSKFLRHHDSEEGDLLLMLFDIATGEVTFSIEPESRVFELFQNDE